MLTLENLARNIFNEWNKHSKILLFLISEDMDILDISIGFEQDRKNFANLSDLITYTHKANFILKVQECIQKQCTLSFVTNFSSNPNDVEDIPQSFTLILYYQEKGKILVLADPICSLSHKETKNYFSMINDFSFLMRKSQKLEYTLKQKNEELNEKIKVVEYLTDHDSLTQIYSRKRILEELKREYNRYIRFLEPFCVVMLDIDLFKKVNDNYGHQNGDIVLKEFSQKVKSLIREYDLFGRFGGEEFLVILPKTEINSAHKLMSRILKEISKYNISLLDKTSIQITCSAGIAQAAADITIDKLILLADTQLYKAKENGRNQAQ
jgi:diguanylate cyclase (GGDEF)-like protein